MEKPDVDRIEGICPAIAIRQKNSIRNPRSTVGTTTEIHDYMRLLFARVGRTFCRQCGRGGHPRDGRGRGHAAGGAAGGHAPARSASRCRCVTMASGAARSRAKPGDEAEGDDELAAAPRDSAAIRSPRRIDTLRRRGFGRLLIDGRAVAFDEVDRAALEGRTTLEVIVDRLKIDGELRTRLTDSIETSYREGGGAAFAIVLGSGSGTDRGPAGSRADRLLRTLRMPALRHRLRDAAAAAVLVQQPVRRLPDLPRLRQRHRARHGSGRARSVEVDQPGRDRAVEQAALPGAAGRAEARGAKSGTPARRAVARPDRRRAPLRRRWRRASTTGIRGFFRWLERKKYKVHVRVFLSRYRGYLAVPGLRRRAAAARGARRPGRRPDDRRRLGAHRARGAGVLRRRWS